MLFVYLAIASLCYTGHWLLHYKPSLYNYKSPCTGDLGGCSWSRYQQHFTSREQCSDHRRTADSDEVAMAAAAAVIHRAAAVVVCLSFGFYPPLFHRLTVTNHRPWTWWLTAQTTSEQNEREELQSLMFISRRLSIMQPKQQSHEENTFKTYRVYRHP